MKRYLVLLFIFISAASAYSQEFFSCLSRNAPVELTDTVDGIWSAKDSVFVQTTDTTYYKQLRELADSTYIYNLGLPNRGDLRVPDLEVKVKTLWYKSEVFFLFRRLDDSLVNGYIAGNPDLTLKDGLENRDATALYFFLDTLNSRLDINNAMYNDESYLDSVAWFRWVWGADEFEGELRGNPITSIGDIGGKIIQWKEGKFNYTKLSVDMKIMAPEFLDKDSTIKLPFILGFDIEVDENDKEYLENDLFGIQTRSFWGSDMDSVAISPWNVVNWGWLYFSEGDPYIAPLPTNVRTVLTDFANIYPNPTRDYVMVDFDEYTNATYLLYDMMGRVVKTGKLAGNSEIIQLNGIQSGSYFLSIRKASKELMVQKILKL